MQSWRTWVFAFGAFVFFSVGANTYGVQPTVDIANLPGEAQSAVARIKLCNKQGCSSNYSKDGVVFGNYEGVLPRQRRGYYHEYTVRTPGVRGRGARRIVSGGETRQANEFYYIDDHYVTFKRIRD